MPYPKWLFPTTVVGSYPPPADLVNRDVMCSRVPRIRMPEMWRLSGEPLKAAQDAATRWAIQDMESAGIDVVTDGEIRRESYGTRFALELEGVDSENPAETKGRMGQAVQVPRIVGPIRRRHSVEVADASFLVSNARGGTKITMPGPYTLMRQSKNEFYPDDESVAMAFAEAINEELKEIKATGVDVVQLDEPWMQAWPQGAEAFGIKVLNRALQDIPGPTVVHVCFGYAHIVKDKPAAYAFLPLFADCVADQISIETAQPKLDLGVLRDLSNKTIMLGVLDLGTHDVETAETVATRIKAALPFVDAERIVPAPDCGMKYMPRDVAFGKLKALSDGAALARASLS